jgi:hypothetical protein
VRAARPHGGVDRGDVFEHDRVLLALAGELVKRPLAAGAGVALEERTGEGERLVDHEELLVLASIRIAQSTGIARPYRSRVTAF